MLEDFSLMTISSVRLVILEFLLSRSLTVAVTLPKIDVPPEYEPLEDEIPSRLAKISLRSMVMTPVVRSVNGVIESKEVF